MKKKLPAFHFYPGDWFKDTGIMALDAIERGVYFQFLLLMFESKRRGYLQLGEKKYPDGLLAKILRISPKKLAEITEKLVKFEIVSVEKPTGIMYSRRMISDEEMRQTLIKAGEKGSKQRWGNDEKGIGYPIKKSIGGTEDENESEGEKGLLNKSVPDFTIDDLNLAQKLRSDILEFKPDFIFEYSEEQWAGEIRFVRRVRKKDTSQIMELWEYAREDEFWKTIILDPWKLVKNWDKLEIARDNVGGGGDVDSWVKEMKAKQRKDKNEK